MLKVTLNDINAQLPKRNTPTDAGLDLFSSESVSIPPQSWVAVDSGISISVPIGYYTRVAPRSGIAFKFGIDVFAGVIDSEYRGNVKAILFNASQGIVKIDVGDKIAQLIVTKCELWEPELVTTLGQTQRGEKGFGSSGV